MIPAQHVPTLRAASDSDLPKIAALLAANDLPTVGVAESLCSFIVADDGTDIVGVVGLEACCGKYALLRSTAVDNAWRSKGIGRRLVERAVSEAESQGVEALYLLTTTAETYFRGFGFSTVTRDAVPTEVQATAEFQSCCPASATVMTLCLTQPR